MENSSSAALVVCIGSMGSENATPVKKNNLHMHTSGQRQYRTELYHVLMNKVMTYCRWHINFSNLFYPWSLFFRRIMVCMHAVSELTALEYYYRTIYPPTISGGRGTIDDCSNISAHGSSTDVGRCTVGAVWNRTFHTPESIIITAPDALTYISPTIWSRIMIL